MDRKKVINGLEVCFDSSKECNGCPYIATPYCKTTILNDVTALLKEQEAKTGYWIDSAGNDKCSNCGAEYSDLYPDYGNTHFYPNCGAKMEGR